MKKIALLFIAIIGLFACKTIDSNKYYGTKISTNNAITYATLKQKMQGVDSLAIKVKGEVVSVCQNKGCWMSMKDQTGEEMFVQFKDYGFFMPMDISGRDVILEGYAYKDVTSVEELQHYAKDAGESQEVIDAITEPEEELKFMASGVVLLDDKKKK